MRALITGAAGFIGSQLTSRCLSDGWEVVTCDNLSDYYDVSQKRAALAMFLDHPGVTHLDGDVVDVVTPDVLHGVDVVFHQAGQPGVRGSWEGGFETYVNANILATQKLFERCRGLAGLRVVLASSSSVYGNAERYPVLETDETRPFSPYGVTKLAAERLALAYGDNFDMAVVVLRYFTVYGPGQRPDMAMHRLIRAALTGSAFPLFGDGSQIRDFTYVEDVVAANLAAATAALDGPLVANVCGGSAITLAETVDLVGEMVGRPVRIDRRGHFAGDVSRTGGDNRVAREVLGWSPATPINEGLKAECAWLADLMGSAL